MKLSGVAISSTEAGTAKGILFALPLRFLQLPAKLSKIDAMLGGLVLPDEDYRDIPSVALPENRIFVDVDLLQGGSEFAQQGCDGGFGFLTKVTSGTRVQGDVARATGLEPRVFGRVVRAHGCGLEYFMNGPELE